MYSTIAKLKSNTDYNSTLSTDHENMCNNYNINREEKSIENEHLKKESNFLGRKYKRFKNKYHKYKQLYKKLLNVGSSGNDETNISNSFFNINKITRESK
jgi:hypothetical protein